MKDLEKLYAACLAAGEKEVDTSMKMASTGKE
jgi:hypothetical protein